MKNIKHERRMAAFKQAGIYLVTSQEASCGRKTVDVVRRALDGGIRIVQLREKGMSDKALFGTARELRGMTKKAGALLIVNDRLDIALAVAADGVHLGQEDFPLDEARKLAPEMVIGASAHSVTEAHDAEKKGASYVNIGPIFPTATKEWDGCFLGIDGFKRISRAVSIPFTVMGGIKKEHIADLTEAGIRTIAVVTAITAAKDPGKAARGLIEEQKLWLGSRR